MANSNWKWAVTGALALGLATTACRDNRSNVANDSATGGSGSAGQSTTVKGHEEQTWNPGGEQGTGGFDSTKGEKTLGNDQGTQPQGWGNRTDGTGGSGDRTWNPGGEQGTGSFDSTADSPTLPGPVKDDGAQGGNGSTRIDVE